MNRSVALVTYVGMGTLAADDLPIVAALAARGLTASIACWDDPTVNWSDFEQVILRSCWNSHLKSVEFLRWLSQLELQQIPVLNSVPLLKWNLSKTYLLELAARGIKIPSTISVQREGIETLSDILARQGWREAVLKPAISASAYATSRVRPGTAEALEDEFQSIRSHGGALVQQFVPEVIDQGELSFVFLGGMYSHTVLKTVAPGDFRVQTDFGGERRLAFPSDNLIAQARNIIELAAPHCAYARLDAIQVGPELVLMELELIDPVLFFGFKADSCAGFADVVVAAISDS